LGLLSGKDHQPAVARFAGPDTFDNAILGLTPQALCYRPLRGLEASEQLKPVNNSTSGLFSRKESADVQANRTAFVH
jgi:hypothetical protein